MSRPEDTVKRRPLLSGGRPASARGSGARAEPEAARGGRGALVVLEGIDGAGKSTQAARVAEALRADGYDVVTSREPTDGPFGRRIREIAREGRAALAPEDELTLFLQDRRVHVSTLIEPALAAGRVVVLDRYYLSTMAYQGALGLDPAEIQWLNEAFAPPPDLALILTLPVPEALARIRAGRADGLDPRFEQAEYLERVAAIFEGMPGRFDRARTAVRLVPASGDPDQVSARLVEAARARLAELGVGPRPT